MIDQQQIDAELIAALFVSDDGEIRCKPDWVPGGCPWTPAPPDWSRLSVPETVGAGILRLMRQRDEALESGCIWEQKEWETKSERDAALIENESLQIRLDAVVENRDAMQEERDEAFKELERARAEGNLWRMTGRWSHPTKRR